MSGYCIQLYPLITATSKLQAEQSFTHYCIGGEILTYYIFSNILVANQCDIHNFNNL